MATSTEKLELLIGAKDKASPVLSKLKSAVVGIGAAYLGWQGVTRIIGDIIDKAAESEKVWNDVAASLDRHGYSIDNNINAVKAFSSELQRMSGISDELAGQSIQLLLDYNVELKDSLDLVRTAADFAAAKHLDMKTAVDLLGKAHVGYTATLSRYGIIVKETLSPQEKFNEAVRQMNERFGGAAQAQLNTYTGQLQLFKENLGDLEETIGMAVLPALTSLLDKTNTYIETLNTDYGKAIDNVMMRLLAFGALVLNDDQMQWVADMNLTIQNLNKTTIDNTRIAKDNKVAVEELANEAKKLSQIDFGNFGYPTLTSSSESFLTSMLAQNEETERTRDILIDLAEKGVNYLVTELELTNDQIVQIIQMAEEMGIAFEGAFKLSADASNENLDMFIAFSEGARSAVTNTANMMVGDVGIALHHMADQSRNYFIKMYMHFVSYFAEAVLEYMANNFVRKFLGILNIFDVAANDRMAMQQGRDFAYYFSSGVLSGIREQNLGLAIAGEIGGYASGRSTGAAMSATAIRKTVIPVIQRETKYGITTIMASEKTMTGERIGYVS